MAVEGARLPKWRKCFRKNGLAHLRLIADWGPINRLCAQASRCGKMEIAINSPVRLIMIATVTQETALKPLELV